MNEYISGRDEQLLMPALSCIRARKILREKKNKAVIIHPVSENYKSECMGICPVCESEDIEIDYQNTYQDMDCSFYPWTCPDCGSKGREWHANLFIGHEVDVPGLG